MPTEPNVTNIVEDRIAMPPGIGAPVKKFLLDKGTGNVVLNIRDGVILKAVIEVHLKPS
jgi:hypothetical protein